MLNQNQQSPVIISQSKEIEADQSFYKVIILGIIIVLLGVAGVYCFNQFLITAESGNFILSLVASILFLTLVILQIFLVKSKSRLGFILFIEAFAPLAIFYSHFFPEFSLPLLIGAVLFFVFMCSAAMKGYRILANSLKINFWVIAKSITPKATSGLLLFFAVLVYLNYFVWGNFNEALGQRFISEFLRSGEPVIRIWIPNFSSEKSIGDTINIFAEKQIRSMNFDKNSGIDPNTSFDQLSDDAKKSMIEDATHGFKSYLSKTLGLVNMKDSVSNVVYRFLENYMSQLSVANKSIIGIAISFFVFLTLKGIAFFFYWLIELIAFLIFKFLLAINFAHIGLETRSREFIVLS
ncbi:MAG: hypothetical protein QMD65_00560 [Patescibacteria group bacterium]|nr:hypothetical protein [Patescibacteria group bacterium]